MLTPPPASTITSASRAVPRVGVSSDVTYTTIGYRPAAANAAGGCTVRRANADMSGPNKTLGRSRLYQSARSPRTVMRQCSATLPLFSSARRSTSLPPGARRAFSGRTVRQIASDVVMVSLSVPFPAR